MVVDGIQTVYDTVNFLSIQNSSCLQSQSMTLTWHNVSSNTSRCYQKMLQPQIEHPLFGLIYSFSQWSQSVVLHRYPAISASFIQKITN